MKNIIKTMKIVPVCNIIVYLLYTTMLDNFIKDEEKMLISMYLVLLMNAENTMAWTCELCRSFMGNRDKRILDL